MNILITGGIGLLSTRLTEFLSKKNHIITLVSREKSKIKFLKNKNIIIKKIDWENNNNLRKICQGIDIIIHCAGPNAKESNENYFNNFKFSGKIFHEFLQIAIKQKVKKFFLLSTIHVYSDNLKNDINEETQIKNNNPYAVNKILSETILNYYLKKNIIKGKILRLSNVVGSPLSISTNCWNLISNNLCYQYIKNNKIIINSNPNTKRNYLCLNDFLNIIEILITSKKDNIGKNNIINVVSSETLSIKQLVKIISGRIELLFNKKPKIKYKIKSNNKKFKLFFNQNQVNKLNYKFCNNFKNEIDSILKFLNSELS